MKIIAEFKEFIAKGNVFDLAIGIVVGGGFGKVVSSLVNDIIMPPVGMLVRGIDFKNLKVMLVRGVEGAPDVTLNYGNFIQTMIEFVIIAGAVFAVIKGINAMRRAKADKPSAPPAPSQEEKLLTEIRDLLKK
jgi:large conductance mechanosensitive channel